MIRSFFGRIRSNFHNFSVHFVRKRSRDRPKLWIWIMLGTNSLRGSFLPASLITVNALGRKKDNKKAQILDIDEQLFAKADQLYSDHEVEKLYDLLVQYKDCKNDEVLWRLARAASDISKHTADQELQKKLVTEAFSYATKALNINENNYASHKWYAILLDATSAFEGMKARILASIAMLEHLQRASELNPKDATTFYSIGLWYFSFADLAWYERKICCLVFEEPPKSSYELALEYFQKAEEVEPNFYSKNTLMLGKTYARLNQNDKAIYHLKKVLEFRVEIPCDIEAQEEALQLLRSLGVKA